MIVLSFLTVPPVAFVQCRAGSEQKLEQEEIAYTNNAEIVKSSVTKEASFVVFVTNIDHGV